MKREVSKSVHHSHLLSTQQTLLQLNNTARLSRSFTDITNISAIKETPEESVGLLAENALILPFFFLKDLKAHQSSKQLLLFAG
jgi:hypothetical protein